MGEKGVLTPKTLLNIPMLLVKFSPDVTKPQNSRTI